jgi:hypothetical protein
VYWQLIQKVPDSTLEGNYKNPAVREYLRNEANLHCVYCAIHENRVGGVQAFHVDHYRPKSRPEFKSLTHALANLFYACPICNRFKGSKWKNEPTDDHSVIGIPDPSKIDYNTLFDIDTSTGTIAGKYIDAKYITEELYLDRSQLRLERRRFYLETKLDKIRKDLQIKKDLLIQQKGSRELLGKIVSALDKQLELVKQEREIPYYELQDVTRQ